jgi:hypothetical protein
MWYFGVDWGSPNVRTFSILKWMPQMLVANPAKEIVDGRYSEKDEGSPEAP